jgi:hypothetical protein
MKKVLKQIINWVFATDKLLHMFVCITLMLAGDLILNSWINALSVTAVLAVSKEYLDLFFKRCNTFKQALEDILADIIGIGIAIALIVLFK